MLSSLLVTVLASFLLWDPTVAQTVHQQRATVGVLVDLHQAVSQPNRTKNIPRVLCGALNVHAFQQLAAVRWAAEIINNKSWPGEFAIDIVVHDTCGESGIAIAETNQIVKWSKKNSDEPLIGVVVIGSKNNERIIDRPLETLNKENVSAIVTSPRAAELLLSKHPNVFTTSPDISSVTEAILALIHQLGSSSVAVISSCSHAIKRFESFAGAELIGAKHYLVLQKDNPLIFDAIIKFLEGEAGSVQSVVLFLESTELERLVRNKENISKFRRLAANKHWIMGSVGVDQEMVQEWTSQYQTTLMIMEPHVAAIPDFQEYFLNEIQNALTFSQVGDETREYIQKVYQCHWASSRTLGTLKSYLPCSSLSKETLASKFHPEADLSFIVSAVSAYSAALRLAQLEVCSNETLCDHSELTSGVIEALRKLNFPVGPSSPYSEDGPMDEGPTEATVATGHELEGTRGRINHQGKLVSRKYDLWISKPSGKLTQAGRFSSETGLVLDMMLGLSAALYPDTNLQDLAETSDRSVRGRASRMGKNSKSSTDYLIQLSKDHVNITRMSPEFYISRVWAMVVVAIGITGVFLTLYILVYVLLRMCDGTLHGNQVLGILLLLGVMSLYGSVVMFVLPPGPLMCNLRVFIPSLAVTMCYGILLLKLMQLRSLVALGLGGRVSSLNQFITLMFIVAVQFAINLQWFFTRHFTDDEQPQDLNECNHPHQTYLLLHSYIGILILVVFIYGTSVLKIRRNYNEARWVTLAAVLSIPIAVTWILIVLFAPDDFQEPTASIVFITSATVILFTIFIPKLSTISKQSSMTKRKEMLQNAGPGYTGSISTIFTTLSDRGHGTLQSQKRNGSNNHHHKPNHYIPPPPPMPSSSNGKSVTYSPRLTTNIFHSSSAATSLARSVSMKTPFFESNSRGAYP
ncbi:unnamed protein product [Allacma fusca]|uniref:G-protein coupled receptors family 3 profile domain-containing protein n=1 Tax=Allacma fusca TaxID=39272 RepID=A0A8J2JEG0_9HEXA|nr:unnamed protein product [Allacma fusca]